MKTKVNSEDDFKQPYNHVNHRNNQESYQNLLSQIKQCVDKDNTVQGKNITLRSNYSRDKTEDETNPEVKTNDQNINDLSINPWNPSIKNQIFENNLIINENQNKDENKQDKLFINNGEYDNYDNNNQNDELMVSNEEKNNNYYNPFNFVLRSINDETKKDNLFSNENINNENNMNIQENDNNGIYKNEENQENINENDNNNYGYDENELKNEKNENNEFNVNMNDNLNDNTKVNYILTNIPIEGEKKDLDNNQNQIINEEQIVNNVNNVDHVENPNNDNQNLENNPYCEDVGYEEEENNENIDNNDQNNNNALYINNKIDPLDNAINCNGKLICFSLTAKPLDAEQKITVNEIIKNDNDNINKQIEYYNNNNQIINEIEDNPELDKNSVSTLDTRKKIDGLSKEIKKFAPQLILLLLGGGLIYLLMKNQKIRDWLKRLLNEQLFMKIWETIKGIFGFITPDIYDFLEKYNDIYRLLGLIIMIYVLWFGFRLFLKIILKSKKKFSQRQ